MRRVLAVYLDGYEHSLAQRLMSAGEMPEMSRLAASSGRFLLDHGSAQRTGLGAEHVATGLSPAASHRWNVIHFDPRSYTTWQDGTRLRPFAADLNCKTVVFDAPYFNVLAAPTIKGVVNWGAHDPGVRQASQPANLLAELNERFGPYPAHEWTYAFAWPSPERARLMGEKLVHAIEVRAEAARWLLETRFPDWNLALVSIGETHSVIESLWHGVDPTHPLHHLPSAEPAGKSVEAVYRAVDRLIGSVTSTFPDAVTVVFAMGGMGVNRSDLPSMLLLPELLYRYAFGSEYFKPPEEWSSNVGPCPLPPSDVTNWHRYVGAGFPIRKSGSRQLGLRSLVSSALPQGIKTFVRKRLRSDEPDAPLHALLSGWVTSAYQQFWPRMQAFATHSYYDGSIRVNLTGRERHGIVAAGDYHRLVSELEHLVRACIDPATGESVVDFVERPANPDPFALTSTQTDLTVVWKGAATCFEHPRFGRIGPVMYRRVGGHTGPFGMAYIRADGLPIGDKGLHSSFNVVPTIIELLGHRPGCHLTGRSLLRQKQGVDTIGIGAAQIGN